jgi:hypothetical protein
MPSATCKCGRETNSEVSNYWHTTPIGKPLRNATQDGGELAGNTAEGDFALHTYITFATADEDNTAIGYSALCSDTTGIANTATGHAALHSNTIGFGNIITFPATPLLVASL